MRGAKKAISNTVSKTRNERTKNAAQHEKRKILSVSSCAKQEETIVLWQRAYSFNRRSIHTSHFFTFLPLQHTRQHS